MATFTNSKTGETVSTDYNRHELAERFADLGGERQQWMWFWIAKMVQESEAPTLDDALTTLQKMFLVAVGGGLKSPNLYIKWKGVTLRFYLSARGTVCIKEKVQWSGGEGESRYVGCIWQGKFLNSRNAKRPEADTVEFFDELATQNDVVGFLARLSKETDCCCYCGRALKDETSKRLGYGAVCAKRWGLPWSKKATDKHTPSLASLFGNKDIRLIMDEIVRDIQDENNWRVFSDLANELGVEIRMKPPVPGARIPNFNQ